MKVRTSDMKGAKQRELFEADDCPCDIVKAAGRWRDAAKGGSEVKRLGAEMLLVHAVDESRKDKS